MISLKEFDTPPPSPWRTDPDSIPFDTEVLVAWNFTKSQHTKSLVVRDSCTSPNRLWLEGGNGKAFILISDIKYWMEIPELP